MAEAERPVRIVVVQNDVDKGPGRIGDALKAAGAALDVRMADDELPSVAGYDGLVVLPGLNDPVDDLPPVHRARAAIEEALGLGRPVLGVCRGGQLVAQALGGEAYACDVEQGYHDVRSTPAAQDDPLLAGVPAVYSSLHAHAWAFTPPPGAVVLLENDVSVQAVRCGERAWAFQCHPEAPIAWVDALARAIRDPADGGLLPRTGDFFTRHGVDPDRLEADARAADASAAAIAAGIGRGFVDACRR
ncbi:MAG: type 1 glutamine amidotransferase [Actinobacteria bacterium]|nr:type 1 glutamine amidotransferase [Actinomycetota bacterium]